MMGEKEDFETIYTSKSFPAEIWVPSREMHSIPSKAFQLTQNTVSIH